MGKDLDFVREGDVLFDGCIYYVRSRSFLKVPESPYRDAEIGKYEAWGCYKCDGERNCNNYFNPFECVNGSSDSCDSSEKRTALG